MKISEKDTEVLEIIRDYCLKIGKTVERAQYDKSILISDDDFFDSVTMKIMQIGEYAKRISDEYISETKEQIDWKPIKGMRDIVAHNYASVDPNIIWITAVNDVPALLEFINSQLGNSQI